MKTKKRQLETGDMKLKLLGHVELDEIGEVLKMEAELEKPDEETEGGVVHRNVGSHSLLQPYETQNGRRTFRGMKSGGLLLQERSLWQVQV